MTNAHETLTKHFNKEVYTKEDLDTITEESSEELQ